MHSAERKYGNTAQSSLRAGTRRLCRPRLYHIPERCLLMFPLYKITERLSRAATRKPRRASAPGLGPKENARFFLRFGRRPCRSDLNADGRGLPVRLLCLIHIDGNRPVAVGQRQIPRIYGAFAD